MAKEVKIIVKGVWRSEPDIRRLARLLVRQVLSATNDGSAPAAISPQATTVPPAEAPAAEPPREATS